MSKTSFRPRQVDYTKYMPIYLNDELPDLQDFSSINRTVPQMPTGMEKEEEAEHHLQRALSAQQVFGISSTEYAIPTPKVEIDNKKYDKIYNAECPKSKSYIRIQPFSADSEYADYDCDSEDEKWLDESSKSIDLKQFEEIMDRLEKATGHSTNLMTADEAKVILKDEINNDLIKCIYEYWKGKRLKYKHPLTPIVLTDKSGVQTQPNNPYLVFRRRTEKMQTRKNRKNEELSYEKMLILKRDLMRAQKLLNFIRQRENLKKDFLKLTLELFEKRYKSSDYDGNLYNTVVDSLASTLKPQTASLINNSRQLSVQNNNNLSSIDKTIANLIHSNDYKALSSPPHSTIKRLPHLDNNNYIINSIVKTTSSSSSTTAIINDENKLDNKKRKKLTNTIIPQQQQQQQQQQNITQKTNINSPKLQQQQQNICKNKQQQNFSEKSKSTLANDLINTNSNSTTCSSNSGSSSNTNDQSVENIKNIEAIINETLNSLSTSAEIDGYWCFKRKEGCKYLAQNSLDIYDNNNNNNKKQKTKEENNQKYKYSYCVSKKNHLGLVRRRVGRGGRIILDRFNNNNHEIIDYDKIKTYYSKEYFKNNDEKRDEEEEEDEDNKYDYTLFPYQLEQLNCLNNKKQFDLKKNRVHPYFNNKNSNDVSIDDNDIEMELDEVEERGGVEEENEEFNEYNDQYEEDKEEIFEEDDYDNENCSNNIKLFSKRLFNTEYNNKSNDCLLDIVNVKFAIKTLKYSNKNKNQPLLLESTLLKQQQNGNNNHSSPSPPSSTTFNNEINAITKPVVLDTIVNNTKKQRKQSISSSSSSQPTMHSLLTNNKNNILNQAPMKHMLTQNRTVINQQQQQNKIEILDNFRTHNPNNNRNYHQNHIIPANSSSLPSSSTSSATTTNFVKTNGTINGNGTSKDDYSNNVWSTSATPTNNKKIFHKLNPINNKLKSINDQSSPNLIDTSSHKTNGDSLSDNNLAMEVT